MPKTAAAPAAVVNLFVLAGLNGTTEPCGCTSDPLGGIDRAVQLLSVKRGADAANALLVVGNTFFDNPRPPARLRPQQVAKARVIGEVLGRLKPAVLALGPFDQAAEAEVVAKLMSQYRLGPLQHRPGKHPISHADSTILHFDGRQIGIVGVSGELGSGASTTAYSATAQGLRVQGVDAVVALVPLKAGAEADAFVAALSGVDVAIVEGGDSPTAPRVLKGTVLVAPPNKGQYVARLSLHWPPGTAEAAPTWLYDDGGLSASKSMKARIQRLQDAVERLSPGAARSARQSKLTALRSELAAFVPGRPRSRYVAYEDLRLGKEVAADPWAKGLMAQSNRALCGPNRAATAHLTCTPAPSAAETYLLEGCQACHAPAFAFWRTTKHAVAWKTLTEAGKECDLGCIGCHSLGYEKAGGYCRLEDAETYANVGCENCHGPGAGHARQPTAIGAARQAWGSAFVRDPPVAVCDQCHTADHSDLFDFSRYRARIVGPGHGEPLP